MGLQFNHPLIDNLFFVLKFNVRIKGILHMTSEGLYTFLDELPAKRD
ncbi:hypothetical protein MTBBW1_1670098 [Desulfamplus magnetovallimortis]|uniref:Uncharacterized protein n=1 Tax=Desulfamplus magnetovallimortis TaxID=1246637 RepID=A0A1W1H9E6_9BACT|nr:hypothetical protein MTBBW1_1670098 [Desulfamplus magnetovallimortis]